MKKSLLLLATALLLPFGSAWANSYYANLKATVSTKSSGMGKVYAGTSATVPQSSSSDWKSDTSTSESQSAGKSQTYTFYAHALANENYEFDYWSDAVDGASVSTDNPRVVLVKADSTSSDNPSTKTVYANFKKKQLASFSVTFAPPSNGSYTIDGAGGYETKGPFTEVYSPKLAATANSGYAFNGWYTTADGTTKGSILSSATPWTGSFSTTTTVMADFVESKTVTTYDELATALENNVCIEIPSGTTIVIESGKSLSLASGKTLIINGTLYVIGTFTNNGLVKGGGALAKITKTITQTGNSDGSPITTDCADASKNKKYYKTTVANAGGTFTNNGTMSATEKAGAIVMRGGSRVAICGWPKSDTPQVLRCAIDGTKAVNHITGFLDPCYNTDVAKGIGSVTVTWDSSSPTTTTKMILLLADASLSNDACSSGGLLQDVVGKMKLQGNFGALDLGGYSFTLKPSLVDNYIQVVLNGKFRENTLLYSGNITCINLSKVGSNTSFFANIMPDYSSTINIYDCESLKIAANYENRALLQS